MKKYKLVVNENVFPFESMNMIFANSEEEAIEKMKKSYEEAGKNVINIRVVEDNLK